MALRCLLMVMVVSLVSSVRGESPPHRVPERALFDGKSLDGWDGDPRLWSVRDGVIHGETDAQNAAKGNTFLIWKDGKLKDFDLSLKFRCNATNNSGIQYRSFRVTGDKARNDWVVGGYQHEIRNENQFPNVSGFIYDERGKRGRICFIGEKAVWENGKKKIHDKTLIDQEGFKELFHLNDWNQVRIVAKGLHIQHYMNGKLVLDFTDSADTGLTEGVLALQLHQGKPMWVEFKDIILKTFD